MESRKSLQGQGEGQRVLHIEVQRESCQAMGFQHNNVRTNRHVKVWVFWLPCASANHLPHFLLDKHRLFFGGGWV